jgi:hypothetical protein
MRPWDNVLQIVSHAELFLLTDPRSLTLFKIAQKNYAKKWGLEAQFQ